MARLGARLGARSPDPRWTTRTAGPVTCNWVSESCAGAYGTFRSWSRSDLQGRCRQAER